MLSSYKKSRSQFPLWTLLPLVLTAGAVASAAAGNCPQADAVALEWLDKMSRSLRQVSYQGVVTLQRGKEMQVMQVSHSVHDGIVFERLTELTGQGAQVERGPHPVDCIHPGDRMLRLEALTSDDHCGIAEHYRFAVADSDAERVAGRYAVRIRIEPRDMYRFGYIMALDRETGLLLKSQTIAHGQQVLETTQFANLSYSGGQTAVNDTGAGGAKEVEDEIAVVHEAQHPGPGAVDDTHSVSRPWTVGWLPRGFAATDVTRDNNGRRTYTDGLTVFSVFLEDVNVEMRSGEGLVRQGGTTTYTRGLQIEGQPVLVTVIGEVPVNTARMVADSVNWVQ